jgi:flagellum-specific peptidoglycan hydrolase FlgJ
MSSPISSNWFYYTTMASMAKAIPALNQTNNPVGGADSQSSFFMMLMNAMMENLEETNKVVTQMGETLPFPQTTTQLPSSSLTAPMTSLFNPITIQPIDKKDVPTTAGDTSDFKFKPMQFIKLDNSLEGKLSGTASHFIDAGKKYDIHPGLLSAIAIHETGNGSSKAVNEKNNVAGMMGKNGLRSYESVEDSIFDMARNLRQNYLNQGKDTIVKIGAKYAPVGAANDPTGLNNHWTQGVNRHYSSLI